jgi:hypothetical protein
LDSQTLDLLNNGANVLIMNSDSGNLGLLFYTRPQSFGDINLWYYSQKDNQSEQLEDFILFQQMSGDMQGWLLGRETIGGLGYVVALNPETGEKRSIQTDYSILSADGSLVSFRQPNADGTFNVVTVDFNGNFISFDSTNQIDNVDPVGLLPIVASELNPN